MPETLPAGARRSGRWPLGGSATLREVLGRHNAHNEQSGARSPGSDSGSCLRTPSVS
jgi:hypothetical protein